MQNSASPKTRVGDWIQTFSGLRFYPFDPRPEEVVVEDIAHALANMCRFNGHCREFYSVAQHSVLVSLNCNPEDALWGLFHDASEAYLCDVTRPVKRDPSMHGYRQAELVVQRSIALALKLPPVIPLSVHQADDALLATEARDLLGPLLPGWRAGAAPYSFTVDPWPPVVAKARFTQRYLDLVGEVKGL